MTAPDTTARPAMTPVERVVTALSLRVPDRVPVALALALHGGKLTGHTIPEVFTSAERVVEASMALYREFGSDVVAGTWYAPIELEAWGSPSIFFDDGPPNAGAPIVHDVEAIARLEPPRPTDYWRTTAMLESIAELRRRLGPDVPILGGVVSPFSLPVMQLGFEKYLLLLLERRDLWVRLMAANEAWTLAWGRAQVEAGATALVYFDPVASATILPPELYAETGVHVAKRVIPQLPCGVVTLLASGRSIPPLPTIMETGTIAIGPSSMDDLAEVKRLTAGRIAIVGNMNGIEMRHWTQAEAEAHVREIIRVAGPGGGLVLSDNHGEIPFQVPLDTIHAIVEAVHTYGTYPLAA